MLRIKLALNHLDSTFSDTHRPIGILRAVYGVNSNYISMSPEIRMSNGTHVSVGGKSLSLGSSQPSRRAHHKQESFTRMRTQPERQPHKESTLYHPPTFSTTNRTRLHLARSFIPPIYARHHLNSPACNESLQAASSSFLFFVDLEGFLLSA